MAVKLRLVRIGKKKQPSYRLVAADSRSPRNGRFIEILGTYNPRAEPSEVTVDNDKALHWLRHGATPTETARKVLQISGAWESFTGEAPPAPPPPKPAKKPAPVPVAEASDELEEASEPLAEEPAAEEAPAEEPVAETVEEASAEEPPGPEQPQAAEEPVAEEPEAEEPVAEEPEAEETA